MNENELAESMREYKEFHKRYLEIFKDRASEEHEFTLLMILARQELNLRTDADIFKPYLQDAEMLSRSISAVKIIFNKAIYHYQPLDRGSRYLFTQLPDAVDGQLSFAKDFQTVGDGKGAGFVFMSLQAVENREIADIKKLTAFDRFVYLTVYNLWSARHGDGEGAYMTISEICKCMALCQNRPSAKQIKDVWQALVKMRYIDLRIDNMSEAKKSEYERYTYNGALLPNEIVSGNFQIGQKGNVGVTHIVHVFREPPLISYLYGRSPGAPQITSYPIEVLAVPISKTENNLRILDDLLTQIGARHYKLSLDNILERCRISDKSFKGRLPERLNDICEYWKRIDVIKSYSISKGYLHISRSEEKPLIEH